MKQTNGGERSGEWRHLMVRQWLAKNVAPVVIDFGRLVGCMGLTWQIKQRG